MSDAASWKGQAFAQIDYADLAVWRTWIDYPVALPHGRGRGARLGGFADGGLQELTADVSLDDVNLRLAKDLPALDLEHLSGRIGARFSAAGMSVDGQRVELLTRRRAAECPAAKCASASNRPIFTWTGSAQTAGSKSVRGSATASTRLELGALASLAAYLPLDAGSRQLLDDFAPRGRSVNCVPAWVGDAKRCRATR
jgi:hypothetical protein